MKKKLSFIPLLAFLAIGIPIAGQEGGPIAGGAEGVVSSAPSVLDDGSEMALASATSVASVAPVPSVAVQEPEEAEPDSAAAAASIAREAERAAQQRRYSSRTIVLFGQDAVVPAGDLVREVVVLGGDARILGEVVSNVVVIGGNIALGEDAVVGRDLVNVFGVTTARPGAEVRGELVVVGGAADLPSTFQGGRGQSVLAIPGAMSAVGRGIFPWVTRGLMWGRVIVPELPITWVVVAVMTLAYLAIGLLFPGTVRKAIVPLEERPFSTFLMGLVTLVATGPIIFVLTVIIVGIPIIPFFIAALVFGTLFGRVAVARRIGSGVMDESDPEDRIQSLRSILIGLGILTVAFMIPLLGLLVWMFVGVFGLGAVVVTAQASFRKENPQKEGPVVPPAPPAGGGPGAGVGYSAPAPYAAYPSTPPVAGPAGGESPGAPFYGKGAVESGAGSPHSPPGAGMGWSGVESGGAGHTPPPAAPPAGGGAPFAPSFGTSHPGEMTGLLAFPRASFWERAGAFAFDLFIALIVVHFLDLSFRPMLLILLPYFIGFWAAKGATVGGILIGLRVVRTDGRRLNFGDAVVRGLSGIVSIASLGAGGFWILYDSEKQAWHDRIAGTYVVKVPRDHPY